MIYWTFVLILLPIWAIFGNILVIVSVFREKLLHNITNYFMVNLAIADLLVATAAMPFHLYVSVNEKWNLGNIFCDISLFIDSCTAIVSKFTLVAISVDRYIAVTHPIKYRSLQLKYRNVKSFIFLVTFIWIFSIAITLPLVFGINSLPERISTICTFYNTKYSIIASVFTFWIPSIILVCIYAKIIRTISKRFRRFSAQINETQSIYFIYFFYRSLINHLQ
jgi:hypothetical protein